MKLVNFKIDGDPVINTSINSNVFLSWLTHFPWIILGGHLILQLPSIFNFEIFVEWTL